VTEPGNMTTSYTYDFANYNPNLEYDLLSETAPGESAGSDNSYDDDSGQVISQSDPDGEVTTFSYNGNYGSAGSTVVSIYPTVRARTRTTRASECRSRQRPMTTRTTSSRPKRLGWVRLLIPSSISSPPRPRCSTP